MQKGEKQCFFCSQNIKEVDYKNVPMLRKFVSRQGKIISTRHTGVCIKHQHMISSAIKRARQMGIISSIHK